MKSRDAKPTEAQVDFKLPLIAFLPAMHLDGGAGVR
jgi:hypothetical protein